MFRFLVVFLFISINCFSSSITLFDKAHILPCATDQSAIRFSTTRSLDNGALKISLLRQLKEIFEIDSFVETGTYLGDTTLNAVQIFNEVYTIELSPRLYLDASERLRNWNNVVVHFGSSDQVFRKLLPSIHSRTLFYLDGHYSGHVTAKVSSDTPILKELKASRASPKKQI